MAKQSMIQRELKRERLISKYSAKRQLLKEELKTVSSYNDKLAIYKKLEKMGKR